MKARSPDQSSPDDLHREIKEVFYPSLMDDVQLGMDSEGDVVNVPVSYAPKPPRMKDVGIDALADAAVEQDDQEELVHPEHSEPAIGVAMLFGDYVSRLHKAMNYMSAHAKATAISKAMTSENDNPLKHRGDADVLAVQSARKAESIKLAYDDAIKQLSQEDQLLTAGFTEDELLETHATAELIDEDFRATYGPGMKPKKGRWHRIDKMEKALGVAPREKKSRRKSQSATPAAARPPVPEEKDEPLMTIEEEERLLPPREPTPVFEEESFDDTTLTPAIAKHVAIITNAINKANATNTRLDIEGCRSVQEYLATDVGNDRDLTNEEYIAILKLYGIKVEKRTTT